MPDKLCLLPQKLDRRRDEDTGDLLSMFMLARDEETGERMDDKALRDEVITMLLAGHETTATVLTWAWGLLALAPEVSARLYAEIDAALGDRAPTAADVPALTYTRMVIDETMCLYFSTGPRMCIGNSFALMAATLVLATLSRRHRLRLVDGRLPEPEPLVTLRPKGGMPMVVERRPA